MDKGIPTKFMILPDKTFCAPLTVYTVKRDGTFVAQCYSVPGGLEVAAESFNACVAAATKAYIEFCRKGIWN